MSKSVKELFKGELKVINIGLETFYNSMKSQGITVVHVSWQPTPKLEERLKQKLDQIL